MTDTNTVIKNLSFVPYYLLRPVRILKSWQPGYLLPDLVAGLTVGLIALPQAIAFALIANLPVEMGLYATVVAAIVGALWGSTNQMQTGPANAISILIFSSLVTVATPGSAEYVLAAGMVAVMAGVLQLGLGLTRLGLLVNFVSHSVIVGFASGAAVLIAVNQVQPLLGLQFESAGLLSTLEGIAFNLNTIHWPTASIGLGTIALLLILKKVNPKLPGPLISMIVASVAVFSFGLASRGVGVIGELPRGLPPFVALPVFDLDLIAELSTGALAVGAIGLIQTTAIARAISSQTGQRIDNNQEFVGQGMANIAAGFFSGYPGSASFARSAVNLKAGAKSAISGIAAGVLVLLAMLALAPLAAFLPRAALAGVLITIAYGLIDQPEIKRIFQGTRGDTVIMVITFLGTLFLRMEFAVLAGILFSFALYILKTSLPRVYPVVPDEVFKHFVPRPDSTLPVCPQLGIIKISGDLYFGAVSHVEEVLLEYMEEHPRQRFLLLRMHGVNNCDISGILMLELIRDICRERGGDLFFMKVQPPVEAVMHSTGFYDKIGGDHFLHEDEAIGYLFYRTIDPAICIYECEVRAFKECQNLPKRTFSHIIEPEMMAKADDVPEISPVDLWQELRKNGDGPVVIDVREPREFERGHVPHAQLFSLSTMLVDEVLPPDKPIVLVCQSGRRSHRAAILLRNKGFEQLQILQGGMLAWKAANLVEMFGLAEQEYAQQ